MISIKTIAEIYFADFFYTLGLKDHTYAFNCYRNIPSCFILKEAVYAMK